MVYAKNQFGIGQISDRKRQVKSQIEKHLGTALMIDLV